MMCSSSIRFKLNRIRLHTAILSKSFRNYPFVAKQVFTDEQNVPDEDMTQLISAVENDPQSNKETCTAYIEKLCGSGRTPDAVRLLQILHSKQIFLNPRTYNMLVTGADEGKNFANLSQIFKDVLLFSNPSPVFYSNLAKAFSEFRDSAPLLKFVCEVSEMASPCKIVIMNKIITGFAESNQMDKALLIFNLMKDLNCKPDLITYNIVLDILGRAGMVDELLHVFTTMKETSHFPDIVSYNSLINSLRRFGRLDLCLVFFGEMLEREVDPNLQTYTAVIDSLGRAGLVEEALVLFGQMKRRGIHPSIYVYRAMISNLKKAGKLKLAISVMEEMDSSVSDSSSKRLKKKIVDSFTI